MAIKHIDNGVNVTTAGTAVPLSATRIVAGWVFLQAKTANTGKIYVGESDVSSTSKMVELSATDGFTFPDNAVPSMYDLKDIYIDASVSGEGVWVGYGIV
ncbi:hypothetical protein LCGC14_1801990 [marine sediment metagenome]|uniref:Uncharacterized protein n=2 Tax=marine sediment metagenome TaxID=412755 RepID=A0A0F9GP47_9ZZZZ